MRIFGVFRAKVVVPTIYLAGLMAIAGGCGEGQKSPAASAADSKKIEEDQRAARTKAFGKSTNPSTNGKVPAKTTPAPGGSSTK